MSIKQVRFLITFIMFIGFCLPSFSVELSLPVIALNEIHLEDGYYSYENQKEKKIDRSTIESEEDILKGGILRNIRPIGGYVFGYTGMNNATYDNRVSMPISELGILVDLPGGWTLHNTYNWSRFFRNRGHFWLNGFVFKQINEDTKVYLGRYRLPIGHDGALSPYVLEFASRSMMGRTISNTRDFGARIVTKKNMLNMI